MKEGGARNENERAVIQEFLDFFDGDPIRAVKSLRNFVDSERFRIRTVEKVSDAPVLMSVEGLSKTYKLGRQRLEVLKNVDLNIHEGEFVAITGASGSGKSTLLQLMGGLDKPTKGKVRFGETNIAKLSDRKLSEFRRQTIGFVFQFFYLQPFLRLSTNLEVPGMFARTKKSDRRSHVDELAARVGLSDRLRHFPKELSGGQMQRAAIARALLNQPKILLADEPTGNLDSVNSGAIIDLFEEIRREFGTAIVVVTHDQAIARRADRRIVLKDGVVV
ncbi:MAG TPA: ABC transporter ATP-binding protein [Candidatus Saccharimonadales bacterium]